MNMSVENYIINTVWIKITSNSLDTPTDARELHCAELTEGLDVFPK